MLIKIIPVYITPILDHSNVGSMKVYSDESMKVKASRRVMETLIKLWWECVSLNIYVKSLEKSMKRIETVSISSKPIEEKGTLKKKLNQPTQKRRKTKRDKR